MAYQPLRRIIFVTWHSHLIGYKICNEIYTEFKN